MLRASFGICVASAWCNAMPLVGYLPAWTCVQQAFLFYVCSINPDKCLFARGLKGDGISASFLQKFAIDLQGTVFVFRTAFIRKYVALSANARCSIAGHGVYTRTAAFELTVFFDEHLYAYEAKAQSKQNDRYHGY